MTRRELLQRLDGVFVPMFTSFTPDGRAVDEEQLRASVRFLIMNGIRILNPAGTTGEFWTLTPQEHRQVLHAVLEEVDAVDPGVVVAAGVSCPNLPMTIELARFAAEHGAPLLQITPTYYLPVPDDDLVAYYRAISEAVDTAIMVYEIPPATGVTIRGDLLARICEECPNVVSIKTASPANAPREFERLVRRFHRRLKIFAATGAYYSPFTYLTGVDGITDTLANAVPAFGLDLHRLARARAWEEMNRIYQDAFDVLEIEMIYGRAGLKEIGNLCGRKVGPTRFPMVPTLRKEDREDIRRRLMDWSYSQDLVAAVPAAAHTSGIAVQD